MHPLVGGLYPFDFGSDGGTLRDQCVALVIQGVQLREEGRFLFLGGAGIPQRLLFFQALGGVFFDVLVQFIQFCVQRGEDILFVIFDGGLVVLDGGLVSGDGGLCGVGLGYQRGQLLFLGELVKLRCAEQGELFLFGQEVLGLKIIGVEVLGIILVGIEFLYLVQHIPCAGGYV